MAAILDLAIGGWTCRCGVTTWRGIRASAAISLTCRCSFCGDQAEVLSLPIERG